MPKTGLLTFNRSLNYGSTLQAWSLLKTLQELDSDPVILDYEPKGYRSLYATFRFPNQKRWLAADGLHLVLLPFFLKRKRDFKRFWRRHYIKTDQVLRSADELQRMEESLQTLVCGSDQIWNTTAKDFDEQFLFPGIKNRKKIAYAVSINSGTIDDASGNHRKWLDDFDRISVREPNSQDQLYALLGTERKVEICLDPTMLRSSEDFRPLMSPSFPREPFIFLYSVKLKNHTMQAALNLAKATGLPVYTLISGIGNRRYLKYRHTIRFPKGGAGPDMFLSLAANAAYVVTDSFHGTVFSIIFHRPFCSVAGKNKDGRLGDDYRIRNILNLVGLQSQFVLQDEVVQQMNKAIDWEKVDRLRMNEAEKSRAFLSEALSGL